MEVILKEFEKIIHEGMEGRLNVIELTIPYPKFQELFGASYSCLQGVLAPLCGRYGLDARIVGWESTGSDVIKIYLKKDFDNPKHNILHSKLLD